MGAALIDVPGGRVPEGHAVSQLGRKLPLVVSPVGLDPPGVAAFHSNQLVLCFRQKKRLPRVY